MPPPHSWCWVARAAARPRPGPAAIAGRLLQHGQPAPEVGKVVGPSCRRPTTLRHPGAMAAPEDGSRRRARGLCARAVPASPRRRRLAPSAARRGSGRVPGSAETRSAWTTSPGSRAMSRRATPSGPRPTATACVVGHRQGGVVGQLHRPRDPVPRRCPGREPAAVLDAFAPSVGRRGAAAVRDGRPQRATRC